uniref:GH3 middle domain-containing protein n=1 Tax=Chromera velia CCMP2878 TaxID=1169474 RepID=A0A0G4FM99_9ALVE|eukprot:Cvel_17720.t1-p1 / transcript=Cvel_17720.t1 / gene=Cvel_17720 / organism=Chromera_velia_CCMP2878 / gene_product=Indole-3-acetic acid-amido synthetase GH3.6, putative / transcript_product=Indole-3-acetic acid-amido synthetase GH3.6, putative / location=Cvel_scaffold1431:1912-8092(-) / protein_length=732 / sequence_SO=supercontig / SO=protein_coding / is_pseudo=false
MASQSMFPPWFWKIHWRLQGAILGGGTLYGLWDFRKFLLNNEERSSSHTLRSAFSQWFSYRAMQYVSGRARGMLELECKEAGKMNERFLLEILRYQRSTDYVRSYGLQSVRSREEFRQAHPITDYNHYIPYINRLLQSKAAQGILTAQEPWMIAETSGVSGAPRLLPITTKLRQLYNYEGIVGSFSELFKTFPQCLNLRKTLRIMHLPTLRECEANGLKIGPHIYAGPEDPKTRFFRYSTPKEAYVTRSEEGMLFLHALFALKDEKLDRIEAPSALQVIRLLTVIENNAEALVEALRTGNLPSGFADKFVTDSDLTPRLPALQSVLKSQADPERAEAVEEALRGERAGLIRRLWPRMNVVMANETGGFGLYGRRLRLDFDPEGWLPIFSPMFATTEGALGVNLHARGPRTFTLLPRGMFFEFLPLAEAGGPVVPGSEAEFALRQKTKFIDEVEEGNIYEVIVTTYGGLYRYRLGELVHVAARNGTCPEVEVLGRKTMGLNLGGEQTFEVTLIDSVTSAFRDVPICDFACIEPQNLEPSLQHTDGAPHYAFFVETRREKPPFGSGGASEWGEVRGGAGSGKSDSQVCLNTSLLESRLDTALCERNAVYKHFRSTGEMAPPRIHRVVDKLLEEYESALLAQQLAIRERVRHFSWDIQKRDGKGRVIYLENTELSWLKIDDRLNRLRMDAGEIDMEVTVKEKKEMVVQALTPDQQRGLLSDIKKQHPHMRVADLT